MKKYRIGIIGYGGFGKFLHYWWSKLEHVEIIAIADSGNHFQGAENCRTYQDWRHLIADDEVDIVSIVTPPGLHAEMACTAMEAGKHVLLEKPIAISEEGALQILNTQKETGMVITVDHMIRYNPIIQELMHIGQSGAFGKLRHAVVNNYAQDEGLPANHWFWNEGISGGIFVEHGVHFFDIINALGNQKYVEVFGSSDSRNESQRDRVAAMVRYDGGLIANYYHAFSGPGLFEQTTIHLAYDLARIEIEGWMPMTGAVKALVNENSKDLLNSIPGWNTNKIDGIDVLRDVSRPEGWGASESAATTNKFKIFSGGIGFEINELVVGSFGINQTKGEVYGKCVQSIILDIIQKIEDPDHKLKITIEDAFEGLRIALLASH